MFKWLNREKISKKYAWPGDTVAVEFTDENGKTETVCHAEIKEEIEIDEVGIFEFENKFEMLKGLGGVFGKSKDPAKKK
jgi:hypothetical protein